MIELNRVDGPPLSEQIAQGMATLIRRGELLAGARLPSVRQMAERLAVSAFTVMVGYDKLTARNLIAARQGAGYFVVGPNSAPGISEAEAVAADPVEVLGFAMQVLDGDGAALRCGSGFLPEDWLTDVVPATLVARVAKGRNALLASSPAQGSLGLRRQLADRMLAAGMPVAPGQIITTIGASHAFNVLLRALLVPGDAIMVEDPGFPFYAAQARAMGLVLVPVPRLADGPDLDALEQALKDHHPKVFVTQTLLHNPTGGSTSAAKCHRLLAIAERYGLAIIEDDIFGDIAPKGATRLAQLDELRRVYYLSSFSKLLSPALRVGFLAVPRTSLNSVLRQKVLGVLGSPGLTEAIVEATLDSGRYQRHTQQVRRKLAMFRQSAQTSLAQAGVLLDTDAAEGLFLWGRLPGVTEVDSLVRKALDAGILLAKGQMFSPTGAFGEHLRFNVAHSCDPRLTTFLNSAIRSQGPGADVRPLRPMTSLVKQVNES